jgi:hypothetical protein
MVLRRSLTAVLLSIGMSWLANPSDAQPNRPDQRPSHIPIPHGEGPIDLQKLFEERLRLLDARPDLTKLKEEDIKGLIDAVRQGKLKIDPRLKDQFKQFLDRSGGDPNNLKLSPEELERFKRLFENMLTGMKPPDGNPITPSPAPPPTPEKNGTDQGHGAHPPDAPPVDPAAQAEAREQIMRWAERLDGVARRFRDSPALQQAFQDMSKALLDMTSNALPGGERLDTQLASFNQMARETGGWFKDSFKSLRKFDLPSMPNVDLPSWRLPSVGALPSVSLPRGLSSLPARPDGWQTILLVVALCALVVIGWKLLGHLIAVQRRRQRLDWKLGPWPIDPTRVATRSDVVLAFEYLSLLLLGCPAQHWNHLEIANQLGATSDTRRQVAVELAELYERARYTPDNELLPAEALAAARRDLCFLAGVPAA